MKDIAKHPQARLYPSELVTIGLLFALKGAPFRAFYRWLKREYHHLFPRLPERTRLQRALAAHRGWCARFLANPTFFTIIDTFGIELIHPAREGRSPRQVGRKGKSNYRWIVGIKLCWLINQQGQVVAWAWKTANVHDQAFRSLATQFEGQTITLADLGFRRRGEPQANLKLCPPGTWPERRLIETVFSLLERVLHLKRIPHRVSQYIEARLAYVAALFNNLLQLNNGQLSLAEFAL